MIDTSLTSQNCDNKMKWAPRTESLRYERALMDTFPHVKWCDLDSHGFNIVDVTGERIPVEYWLLDTFLKRTPKLARSAIWEVKHGEPN